MSVDYLSEMPTRVIISGQALSFADIVAVARQHAPVTISDEALEKIRAARMVIDRLAVDDSKKVYGITTGFGHLSKMRISSDQQVELQYNLIRSHAAGVGEPLSEEVTRAMMVLLAASLARGHSGVHAEIVLTLADMLNAGICPLIPSRGSVGASGDLAPLSHLALTLIGEGEAIYQGQKLSGAQALEQAGLKPISLHTKEGLALINGTHLMEAIAVLAIVDAQVAVRSAEVACAMSLEGLLGSHVPLDPRIHQRRGQAGQIVSATRLRQLVRDSALNASHQNCARVQDPYTLRCAPQVIGAVRDAIEYCATIFERELHAVTDNPLIFPDEGDVLSGGNFHGQPLALALDMLAIALAQLASFSERRVYNVIGPHDWEEKGAETTLFLTPHPGLHSGLMIAQYVAASLVNEIKVLAHPASIDSIPTSAGMEDFVSMGVTSAHKLRRVIEQTQQVLAIELLCAAQLLDFRLPLLPGSGVQQARELVRAHVATLKEDRVLSQDIEALVQLTQSGQVAEIE
ncbi:histidine ammonia-lyase [Dictyobacter formicarum]|uniref:Histidine ammonia-lyase n=2 Tax=Dictyobacter formicarum TaxID=2778368 RepID=A0ABQ3VHM9_9CHLR|nr:histidine ammonia-lyase [Dictyobacter formicarum]GHO84971.1 histidine ammonia-lyase [Dictyobacter formicarum]